MELLTQANAILGQGQMSLAKYLFIASDEDCGPTDIRDVGGFLQHMFARIDPMRDLHFQTNSTIDTLDYSGTGLNQGSKVVIAARGPARRALATQVREALALPEGFSSPRLALPGMVVVQAPPWLGATSGSDAERFAASLSHSRDLEGIALVVLADDAEFASRSVANFVWVTFTRSNPATDIYGIDVVVANKAWGCRGALIIDARKKSHHAPPLVEDPAVTARVNALGERGRSLFGIV